MTRAPADQPVRDRVVRDFDTTAPDDLAATGVFPPVADTCKFCDFESLRGPFREPRAARKANDSRLAGPRASTSQTALQRAEEGGGLGSVQSRPSSSSMASNGSTRTRAASSQKPTMVHAPSRRRRISSVRSVGFTSHA